MQELHAGDSAQLTSNCFEAKWGTKKMAGNQHQTATGSFVGQEPLLTVRVKQKRDHTPPLFLEINKAFPTHSTRHY